MKRVTLSLNREVLEKLSEKIEAKNLTSITYLGLEVLTDLIEIMESRWIFLSSYFGVDLPIPKFPEEVVRDFLKDLIYLTGGKQRFEGSEFLFLFGEMLAKRLGLPVRETARKLSQGFWGITPICNGKIGWEVFSPECRKKWEEVLGSLAAVNRRP